jgi:glycosyl transferase, family 25
MTTYKASPPDMGINEAFPFKICINLDRRSDRWKQMQQKFDLHGITAVRRFKAFDGSTLNLPENWTHTPGAYGCLLSHVEVVEEARRRCLSQVLIFEDDAVFDPQFQDKFGSYFKQVPRDWDMLFFGALHKDEPIQVSDNIARITRANSTYAYALRDTVFDDFIELNRKAETVLDNASFVLQERFNCYCFTPHLAWVETDYSDAQSRLEHHWYLKESLVLFGAHVDRLLSETTLILAHRAETSSGRARHNLLYLVRYYNEFFSPYIEIVIVEQGAQSTITPDALPANCKHLFVQDEGPLNRERCFDKGIDNSNSNRKFLILSDSDIYLETLDIRANLRMCERYDYATGCSEIIDLTDDETLRLQKTNTTRGLEISKSASHRPDQHPGFCCFVSRDAIQTPGRSNEPGSENNRRSILLKERSRIFQSPNHALRLARIEPAYPPLKARQAESAEL